MLPAACLEAAFGVVREGGDDLGELLDGRRADVWQVDDGCLHAGFGELTVAAYVIIGRAPVDRRKRGDADRRRVAAHLSAVSVKDLNLVPHRRGVTEQVARVRVLGDQT